jgi:hypothetical protein
MPLVVMARSGFSPLAAKLGKVADEIDRPLRSRAAAGEP